MMTSAGALAANLAVNQRAAARKPSGSLQGSRVTARPEKVGLE